MCGQSSTLIIYIETPPWPRARSESSKREQNRPNERPNGLRCSGEKLEKSSALQLAGELGFEPRLTESESAIHLLFLLAFFTKCALTLPFLIKRLGPIYKPSIE